MELGQRGLFSPTVLGHCGTNSGDEKLHLQRMAKTKARSEKFLQKTLDKSHSIELSAEEDIGRDLQAGLSNGGTLKDEERFDQESIEKNKEIQLSYQMMLLKMDNNTPLIDAVYSSQESNTLNENSRSSTKVNIYPENECSTSIALEIGRNDEIEVSDWDFLEESIIIEGNKGCREPIPNAGGSN